jgi:hypothetical protein
MEILFILGGWVLLAFFAAGIAQGSGKWESEDFPFSKPTAKLVRTVDGRPPAPKQRTNPSEAIAKSAERAPVSSQDPSETTAVRSVMQRQPSYCFENQSVDEVRKIMRELHLQYLVVLDEKMRVVGTVKMEDLDRGKKQDPPRGSE